MKHNFRELNIWKKSMALVIETYILTRKLPDIEKFALVNQVNRSVVSIPSNIAEGWGRSSIKDYIRFLYIAKGSLLELETQFIISKKLNYFENSNYVELCDKITSILMMLNKLISRLKAK
ncbi:MAG: four helix bundle protein [Cyclobacteriaceae bacterium]|nr:four helix bundle protein [Cyclobacteriaceae bacterium]